MGQAGRVFEHDVVIVGGGNAGISLAAKLRRDYPAADVAIVAPESRHLYRPLLSYVGGGLAPIERALHDQKPLIPAGCHWYQDRVVSTRPSGPGASGGEVTTSAGHTLRAPDLVLCPGSVIDYDALPGFTQASATEYLSSNYDPSLAPHTWRVLSRLTSGRAVFVISAANAPCPGVGLKPLFLAADHWRRQGVADRIDITVVTERTTFTGLPAAERVIEEQLRTVGATVHRGVTLREIDPDRRVITATTDATESITVGYDAAHVVPPYRGQDWIASAGLSAAPSGLVWVDAMTLEHPRHPGVWALGDAADLATESSGGGLRRQVPALAANLAARRGGALRRRHYNGYSVAPVPVDRKHLLLAEWDRNGSEDRTLPGVSLSTPRASTFAFDLYVQPWVYWHRLLKGKV